jgi:hypothetical protein
VKAFVERQKLSAEAETVLGDNEEDEKAINFLKRTLTTGHRYLTLQQYLCMIQIGMQIIVQVQDNKRCW